jgi:hypothetical protein
VTVTRYGEPIIMILPYALADEVMREYLERNADVSRAMPA